MSTVVGLDFGTTNSAIAVATPDAKVTLATFPDGDRYTSTFRSVLYFDTEHLGLAGRPRAVSGPEAISLYLQADTRGRLIQSLKSHLASTSFTQTVIFNRPYTLEALIALLIRQLKAAAEAQLGRLDRRVVVGRPVHFSGAADAAGDALALRRLQAALQQGGFDQVEFEFEPVAAAYQYEQQLDHDALVLIADFGGGTSDFSLIRLGPTARQRQDRHADILGTDGVGVAGDTFDSTVVRRLVAPHLGLGAQYRSLFGRVLPVPGWIYEHLERWHHLSFLKTRETMTLLHQLRAQAFEPEKIDALIHVVEEDLGYHLFRAVEQTKCTLSERTASPFQFHDPPVQITAQVCRDAFETWIDAHLHAIAQCVDGLLVRCNVTPSEVESVFLTGGSSFVPAVRRLFAQRFGVERLRGGDELTTVAKGLALRALQQ